MPTMPRVAFINSQTFTLHSIYIPNSGSMTELGMPQLQEPETPKGCIRVLLPESIVHTDAIKIERTDAGEIRLIPDEEKLSYLRSLALPHIRKTRNELLSMCDYRMMSDYSMPDVLRQQWAAYRQSLREITTQDPLAVVWPQMPN